MIISEMFNGFKISFDDKYSLTITKEEAKRILDYLRDKEATGAFKDKQLKTEIFRYFDCGEY